MIENKVILTDTMDVTSLLNSSYLFLSLTRSIPFICIVIYLHSLLNSIILFFQSKMLRLPFIRSLPTASRALAGARCNSTQAPEKVEVFVDDQRVLVDPGTTVLQVKLFLLCFP